MKAHIQRTDASILLAHAYPGRMQQIEVPTGSITGGKAQLLACSNADARTVQIKLLKAQVDVGTYVIDSRAIAQKMLMSGFP